MNDGFDFVIVGAGTAGCVLANRLTEDPSARVLLLEAGGRDTHPFIQVPLGLGKIHQNHMFDWGYHYDEDDAVAGRGIEASRGKVLGGSSSINVMAYVRGNRGDYDRWAREGAEGWSYADVLPYFKRTETWEGGETTWRGGSGHVGTIRTRSLDPIWDDWLEAGRALGYPFTDDYNGEVQEGFSRSQFTIRDGRRSSASRAYLRPALRRPNLTVRTGCHATRVILQGTRASGIAYLQGGKVHEVTATREVILAGGTFNSPQLLMLSGIGPAAHLREQGIQVKADVPVGQNLQDHLATLLTWSRPTRTSKFRDQLRADRISLAMVQAYMFGTGPATVPPGGLYAFIKLTAASEVPDIQFLFRGAPTHARMWFPGIKPAYEDGFGIRPVILHPKSRGELLLRSPDPLAAPRLVPRFFSEPDDLMVLREGVKQARETVYHRSLDGYRGNELNPGPDVRSDAQLETWIRQQAMTAHHPAGTCRMGTGPEAVVDLDLKVRGVDGLRVIDASVMPDLVSGNINACVFMIAEKGADLVRGRTAMRASANIGAPSGKTAPV